VTDTTLSDAEAWLAAGRAAEALMAAEMRLARAPGDRPMADLRERALAAILAMDPVFAALQLDAALNSEKIAAHLELGRAYLALERLADAERCFKQALALDAGSVEARALLAEARTRVARTFRRRLLYGQTAPGAKVQRIAAAFQALLAERRSA
jgi:tetratricopeptide (TPR) repeat protein